MHMQRCIFSTRASTRHGNGLCALTLALPVAAAGAWVCLRMFAARQNMPQGQLSLVWVGVFTACQRTMCCNTNPERRQ